MSRVLPILFNTEMVQAILDGRKTVTRRICKDANEYTVPDMSLFDKKKRTYAVHNYADREHTNKLSLVERTCPICPGDILYVRERYCVGKVVAGENPDGTDAFYVSQDSYTDFIPYEGCIRENIGIEDVIWHPSIHMPKEAARIWLKVTDVRVERLQDITGEQCIAEGVEKEALAEVGEEFAKGMFHDIWDSTIKKSDLTRYGWEANPWVWVIEFERCEKPEEWR